MPVKTAQRYGLIVIVLALVAAGLAFAGYHFFAPSKNRNALWTIAHDKCVPDQVEHQKPAPCAVVDLSGGEANGYVILKDIRGVAQYLMIPTRRITGIEAADILSSDLPNYWADAWAHRDLVAKKLHRDVAWNMIGLAINSAAARSQDQLHIHIDCVRPDVRAALSEHGGAIGQSWTKLPFDLAGARYHARRLSAADLASHDPFKLLADGMVEAHADMGAQTLAMIGVTIGGADGFVLLAAGDSARAHSEDLLDHSCAVAK